MTNKMEQEVIEIATREELIANKLIDVWISNYGQMPWAKAVEVMFICGAMDETQKANLLALAD